jgi:hypothetical protein
MKKDVLVLITFNATILVLILLSSCNNNWKLYVVKAGNHSANKISLPRISPDGIDFSFKVNSSWYYPAQENPGWSKIRGISQGHHKNNSSARLGYQCLNDSVLVVGAYCYIDGVSPQENPIQKGIIDTVQPGNEYHCIISRENGKYVFNFEGRKWECPAGKDKKWGYILNPYIGGEYTLDHDWSCEIRDFK